MIVYRSLFVILIISLTAGVPTLAQEDTTGQPPAVIANNKLMATAMYYDAVRARNKGDIAEAEDLLNKAKKLDPDAAGIYYDLARLNLARKQMAQAEKNILKAIELQPDNRWYKDQYANLLVGENKFKKAAEVYEQILQQDENDRENLQTIAYLYQRAGEKEKARKAFDKLLDMYGDEEEILERKLQMHLNNNELDEAMEVNNLLLKIAPNESKYHVRLAEMYNNNNEPDKAAEVYRKAIEIFPDDPGIQLSLSEYYKNKGDTENYRKYLRKVVVNNALEPSQQLTILGGFIISAEDSADKQFALDIAEDVAEQSPGDAMAVAAYGDMLGITGKMEQAAEQYKKSVEIDPANYVVWKNLLSVYLQLLQADSIIKYSGSALRKFPNQANLHYINGMGYNLKKEYSKALNSLERAADMMPEENRGELAGIYSTLADVYNSTKEYELSDEYFDKALKLAPDNPTTLNNYAYYLSERNTRLDDAEKMSARSLELAPNLPTFLDTYGWIMYQQGNYKKAKEYIEKAIAGEEAAASGTLWEHLGDVYLKLKDKNKAVESWQKAKELGVDNPDIDKKLKEHAMYE